METMKSRETFVYSKNSDNPEEDVLTRTIKSLEEIYHNFTKDPYELQLINDLKKKNESKKMDAQLLLNEELSFYLFIRKWSLLIILKLSWIVEDGIVLVKVEKVMDDA